MTPRAEDRDHAAAINEFNARTQESGEAIVRTLVAAIIGVLLALALVHWFLPCTAGPGALCAFGLVNTRSTTARRWPCPAWARRWGWHLQAFVLERRLLQLLGTVQAAAMDPTCQDADVALHLVRACDVRNQLDEVRQRLALDARLRAALR